LAVGGFVLAQVNSHNLSAIKIDFSEELRAGKMRAEAKNSDTWGRSPDLPAGDSTLEGRSPDVPTGDSTPDGRSPDLPTAEEGRLGNLPHRPKYAYREGGKARRTEGKQLEGKVPIDVGEADETDAPGRRTMTMHEVAQANRLDRLNLFIVRWTLLLAAGVFVIDYFRRFNTTFGCYAPLPFSSPAVDSLFPKSHTVCVGRRRRDWKKHLKRMVRKGETFVFFARKDPWPKRRLRRLPWYIPVPWRIDKVVCTNGDRHFDDEFLFESAWFGRYCFVMVGDGQSAVDLLDSLAGFLELRRATRASARRTVNVVWDLETDVPDATLDRLLPLCPETNFRLIVVRTTPPDAATAGRFQETSG